MRDYLLVMSLVLLAGCPELVGVDDPRTVAGKTGDGGVHESGFCTGGGVSCEDRTQAQCNSGCTIAPGCRSPKHEQCATHRDSATCNADSSCDWLADACRASSGTSCEFFDTESECASGFDPCTWGPACTGTLSPRCFEIETRAACEAGLGCRWVVSD